MAICLWLYTLCWVQVSQTNIRATSPPSLLPSLHWKERLKEKKKHCARPDFKTYAVRSSEIWQPNTIGRITVSCTVSFLYFLLLNSLAKVSWDTLYIRSCYILEHIFLDTENIPPFYPQALIPCNQKASKEALISYANDENVRKSAYVDWSEQRLFYKSHFFLWILFCNISFSVFIWQLHFPKFHFSFTSLKNEFMTQLMCCLYILFLVFLASEEWKIQEPLNQAYLPLRQLAPFSSNKLFTELFDHTSFLVPILQNLDTVLGKQRGGQLTVA